MSPEATTKVKEPKKTQMVVADPLRQLLSRTSKSESALASELGSSYSTVHEAIKSNKMHLTLSLACEAMLRRLGPEGGRGRKPKALVLLVESPDHLTTLHGLCSALGIKITEVPL